MERLPPAPKGPSPAAGPAPRLPTAAGSAPAAEPNRGRGRQWPTNRGTRAGRGRRQNHFMSFLLKLSEAEVHWGSEPWRYPPWRRCIRLRMWMKELTPTL